MKRAILVIVYAICFVIIFAGCKNVENRDTSLVFSFDSKGEYKGFNNLPSNCTVEIAEKAGYYVMQDLKAVANKNVWDKFIKSSSKNRNTAVRIAHFYSKDAKGPFFIDLYYHDGYYYLFDSTAENMKKQPYKHLLKLKGQFGNPLKDNGVIVLTDDKSLTFDKLMAALLSSKMDINKSLPSHRIVMFYNPS